MKFKKPSYSMYHELVDWKEGDELLYFDYMPSGDFEIVVVKATNSKGDIGSSHVSSTRIKLIFKTPKFPDFSMLKSNPEVWPSSFYKNYSDLGKRCIPQLFEKLG